MRSSIFPAAINKKAPQVIDLQGQIFVEVRGLASPATAGLADPWRGSLNNKQQCRATRVIFAPGPHVQTSLPCYPDTKMPPPYGAEALLFVVGGGEGASIEHLLNLLTVIQKIMITAKQ